MPPLNPEAVDEAIESCVDDLDERVATLEKYPDTVLAFALRIHLANLLQALLESEQCTRDEIRQFLRELERKALS